MQRAPHSAPTLQAANRASCVQRGRVRIAALASWAHSRSDQLKKGHRRFPVKVDHRRQQTAPLSVVALLHPCLHLL